MDRLRNDPGVSRIICLVRAADNAAALKRVSESLIQRRLSPLSTQDSDEAISCLPVKLGEPELGLSMETTRDLRETATHIIHVSSRYNFDISLAKTL